MQRGRLDYHLLQPVLSDIHGSCRDHLQYDHQCRRIKPHEKIACKTVIAFVQRREVLTELGHDAIKSAIDHPLEPGIADPVDEKIVNKITDFSIYKGMGFLGIDGSEISFAQLAKVYELLLIYLSVLGAKPGKSAFPIG